MMSSSCKFNSLLVSKVYHRRTNQQPDRQKGENTHWNTHTTLTRVLLNRLVKLSLNAPFTVFELLRSGANCSHSVNLHKRRGWNGRARFMSAHSLNSLSRMNECTVYVGHCRIIVRAIGTNKAVLNCQPHMQTCVCVWAPCWQTFKGISILQKKTDNKDDS